MLAYRLLQAQTQPEFQEVPEPHAGAGQVVVKVAGSGLCHTDFTVISRDRSYWKDDPPPFTLAHEIAGWVEELGTGVTKFHRGDAVAVNPSWASCGRCHMCRSGEENHCLYQKAIRAAGVGYDGGHAPYVLVPEERFLVPIGDLDPVMAAPLTDAGITTYSAIKPALPAIWPGSTVVVIGVGGLGLYAVQFLRQLTGARVVAVDSTEARLKLAREYGADDVVTSGPNAAQKIRELSGGIGAIFILDCVGVNATLATAVAALSWRGRLTMVGSGGGSVPFDFFKVPPGAQLTTSLNGGSIALMDVVQMAALGRLKVLVDRYPLDAAKKGMTISSTDAWSVGRCSYPQQRKVQTVQQRRLRDVSMALQLTSVSRYVALLGMIFCPNSHAQQTQFQFLPETDAYYTMSSTLRLDFQAKETREAGDLTQAEIGPSLDWFVKPLISLEKIPIFDPDKAKSRLLQLFVGYRYLPSPHEPPVERMEVGFISNFPFPAKFLLSDRNRADLDWSNGGFNWRYRNRPKLQRTVPVSSYKPSPYVSAEFFYLSQYQKWSTTALYAGALCPVGKRLSLDAYYEHQNLTGKHPNQQLNQLGIILNIYLHLETEH